MVRCDDCGEETGKVILLPAVDEEHARRRVCVPCYVRQYGELWPRLRQEGITDPSGPVRTASP